MKRLYLSYYYYYPPSFLLCVSQPLPSPQHPRQECKGKRFCGTPSFYSFVFLALHKTHTLVIPESIHPQPPSTPKLMTLIVLVLLLAGGGASGVPDLSRKIGQRSPLPTISNPPTDRPDPLHLLS